MTKRKHRPPFGPKHPNRQGVAYAMDQGGGLAQALAMTSDQVNDTIDTIRDDPNTRLVLYVMANGGKIYAQILSKPSVEILRELEDVVNTYRKVVEDWTKGQA